MSLLKKLFGGGDTPEPSVEIYKDYRITPTLKKEADGYRIAARIEKDIEGETKAHDLIRADTIASHEDALAATIAKAKQIIDEQGDWIFR
ncbi:HlyU family transcriptional regulator [uncultured Tateyamaria sp.]|uniref:HlyU family transcriptional regulator n=1 Tax=uncultured Tateyamaria sp. TaxID=455651 RepID=UPI0026254084|nr:HlyU family transcriptional regulator [uncultured Tateyamaria sp.]